MSLVSYRYRLVSSFVQLSFASLGASRNECLQIKITIRFGANSRRQQLQQQQQQQQQEQQQEEEKGINTANDRSIVKRGKVM